MSGLCRSSPSVMKSWPSVNPAFRINRKNQDNKIPAQSLKHEGSNQITDRVPSKPIVNNYDTKSNIFQYSYESKYESKYESSPPIEAKCVNIRRATDNLPNWLGE